MQSKASASDHRCPAKGYELSQCLYVMSKEWLSYSTNNLSGQ